MNHHHDPSRDKIVEISKDVHGDVVAAILEAVEARFTHRSVKARYAWSDWDWDRRRPKVRTLANGNLAVYAGKLRSS